MKRGIYVAALCIVVGTASVAGAVLQAVGPAAPIGPAAVQFPTFYTDTNGLSLEPCLEPPLGTAAPGKCLLGAPFAEVGGIPDEFFYWSADAAQIVAGCDGLLVMALEAAFQTDPPANLQQVVFGRIRIRIDAPGPFPATITVNHPFGSQQFVVDALVPGGPEVNFTSDIGTFPAVGTPPLPGTEATVIAAFAGALQAGIGPFLTWDNFGAVPADARLTDINGGQYVGDGATEHAVVGGTNGNAFTVSGGGCNINQPLFVVSGKLAAAAPAADADGDGVPDANDAFPADPAVAGDGDGDGAADAFLPLCPTPVPATRTPPGCSTAAERTASLTPIDDNDDSGLPAPASDALLDGPTPAEPALTGTDTDNDGDGVLNATDKFPSSAIASADVDNDGLPDAFIATATPAQIAASGLVLDTAVTPPAPPPAAGGGGGGGGCFIDTLGGASAGLPAWLLGLVAAFGLLRRKRKA
ncbi:MAG: hypothetical protein HY900_29995 [Deltaproteobacteria bacterium]|nr:hypothetical protein [Deltaproteobacteria bacterium]